MSNLQQTIAQGQPEKVPLGVVQHNLSDIRPISSEIAHLWSTYLAESMAICMLKHMVAKSKDPDIHNFLQWSLDISSQRVQSMEDIFNSIQHPIPYGFGEEDVDIDAEELFHETFSLRYTRLMTRFMMKNNSVALSDSARIDFRNYFSQAIKTSIEKMNGATDLLLAKGLFNKTPEIPIPDKVEYVNDNKYYGAFFGRSDRSLNVMEINNIYSLMDFKLSLKTMMLGFAQVIKSEKIRDYLNKGLHMVDKQLETLQSFLENENLPTPKDTDFLVTESKESPYSDRLMLLHVTLTKAYLISSYGLALTDTARKDLVLSFSRSMAEIMEYTKEGIDLLIENKWLERAPEAANRQELTH